MMGVNPRFQAVDGVIYVVGAQKCGTSWLQRYLAGHPEVCCPPYGKEVNYWDVVTGISDGSREAQISARLDAADRRARWRPWRAKRAYRAHLRRHVEAQKGGDEAHDAYADFLFQTHRGERYLADNTPAYMHLSSETYARMDRLGADCRFVFLMRDPVDRLHSAMHHHFRKRLSTRPTEATALEWFDEVTEGGRTIVASSRYDLAIERLEAAVPRERIGCFFFEEIFTEPGIRGVTDFLRLSPFPADFSPVNAGSTKSSPMPETFEARARTLLRPVYRAMRERFGARLPAAWRAEAHEPAYLERREG